MSPEQLPSRPPDNADLQNREHEQTVQHVQPQLAQLRQQRNVQALQQALQPNNQYPALYQSMVQRLKNIRLATDRARGQLRSATSVLGSLQLEGRALPDALDKMIEGATCRLPPDPQDNREIEPLEPAAQRYFFLQRTQQSDDRPNPPFFAIKVNMDAIRQDQETIRRLQNGAYANNQAAQSTLRALSDALEDIARQDTRSYRHHQLSNAQNGSSEGLAMMGKLALGVALGMYALVDTTISVANRRVPTVGIMALGAAAMLHRPYRRMLFGPAEQAMLEEADSVLQSTSFRDHFVDTYGIYAEGERWALVFEEWMTRPARTREFFRKMLPLRGDGPAQERLIDEYMQDLGVGQTNPIRPKLRTMILQTRMDNSLRTDFEELFDLLQGKSRDARETILAAIRTDRGRRVPAGAPTVQTQPQQPQQGQPPRPGRII